MDRQDDTSNRSPNPSHSSTSLLHDLVENTNFGEQVELVVGIAATALTADQILKLSDSKKHKVAHAAKAGISAVVAGTAFHMLAREHREKHEVEEKHQKKLLEAKKDRPDSRQSHRGRAIEAHGGWRHSRSPSPYGDMEIVRYRSRSTFHEDLNRPRHRWASPDSIRWGRRPHSHSPDRRRSYTRIIHY